MKKSRSLESNTPSAMPKPEDISRWQSLPRDERVACLKLALNSAADGPRSTRTMQDIKDDALAKINSFAAPSLEDIVEFEAMAPEEQKAVILAELEKGYKGAPVSLTKHISREIFARALARFFVS